MLTRRRLRPVLAAALVAGLAVPLHAADAAPGQTGPDDAVVIAVIDSGITPYHWDFLASKMPQATNRDRSDDLPLRKPAHTWLPGFPSPSSFASYTSVPLTLEESDGDVNPAELDEADADKWADMQVSNAAEQHWYSFPGTKVIGAMSFSASAPAGGPIHSATNGHGTGVTSVSVGNIHGTCPECLLVFLQYGGAAGAEDAIRWAARQPWIDVITNSYGINTTGVLRDNVYTGADPSVGRAASDRGQTIFWSGGNGVENAFTVPNNTLTTNQKGPDWIITVGAADPGNRGSYLGSGKPVDVSGVGSGYPSAYTATTISGTGRTGFSGTSNATPTIAGTYGRALYLARRAMAGRSRVQDDGVIARGSFRCGAKHRGCELGDGVLTATEMRFRLLQSAISTGLGNSTTAGGPTTPRAGDAYFASEGHGTYFARLARDDAKWLAEFDQVWRPLSGAAPPPARPDGERDWFITDSYCRQRLHGHWTGGYYIEGKTPLPPIDPQNWPTRAAYQNACVVGDAD